MVSCPFWAASEGELGKTKLCILDNSALCTAEAARPIPAQVLWGPGTVSMVKCTIVLGQESGGGSVDGFDLLGIGHKGCPHVVYYLQEGSLAAAVEWRMYWGGEAGDDERQICPLSLGGWVALADKDVSLNTAAHFWYSTALLYNEVLDLDLFVSLSHVFHLSLCLGSLVSEAGFGEDLLWW